MRKDGDNDESILDPLDVVKVITGNFSENKNRFQFNLNPKLARSLVETYSKYTDSRYKIPNDRECRYFSFGDFKKGFTIIQAILYGRFISRSILAMNGLKGLGYGDSVLVLEKVEFINRLAKYSCLEKHKIKKIVTYLTFGEVDIRDPDVATQPIIDLKNGFLALAPFIFLNSNSERNFCVLLNQIDDERYIYSTLTQQKEEIRKNEIIDEIRLMGYTVESGKLNDTDLDLAIIDKAEKVCVTFELKWFIGPAEIRESLDRSKELEKGVGQAKKIAEQFAEGNKKLINEVLNIDENYEFISAVGSRNWIGNFYVQCESIPIIKIKHFVEELKAMECLKSTAKWIKEREYLPKETIDY